MITIDLDDTLLNDDLKITEANKTAIEEALKQNKQVVPCTGRATFSMNHYLNELNSLGDLEYLIVFNGAMIWDLKQEKHLFFHPIKADIVNDLIDVGRAHDIDIHLYDTEAMYVERHTERTKAYEDMASIVATQVSNLNDISHNGSVKVLYNGDPEELEVMRKLLAEKYDGRLNIFYSKPYYLECLDINASKGLAALELASILGIKPEEVISVGDSYNDLSMIQLAGLGVAMQNSNDEIKSHADYVTTRDNNNSGVAEVIEKFML